MCRRCTRAMPAIGLCLLSGLVPGCAVHWTPPDIPVAPADTTALGERAELPMLAMQPGETRRIALPVVVTKPTSPRVFVLRGDGLTFRLGDSQSPFAPILRGALPAPPLQGVYVVRVDSLAVPGDTLSFYYTVSSVTQPPRFSRWLTRVVVEMPLLVVDGFAATEDHDAVGPNPFNPPTTLRYTIAERGHVSLVVYDVRGQPVATLVNAVVEAGAYAASWNGCDGSGRPAGSGVYFARLSSPAGTRSYKMTLLK